MGRRSTHGIQLENAVDSTCALQGERGSRLHIYVSGPIQGLPEGSFKLHVDVALDEFFWSVETRTSQQSVSVSVSERGCGLENHFVLLFCGNTWMACGPRKLFEALRLGIAPPRGAPSRIDSTAPPSSRPLPVLKPS